MDLHEAIRLQIQEMRFRQENLIREGQDKLLRAETIGAEVIRMESVLDKFKALLGEDAK